MNSAQFSRQIVTVQLQPSILIASAARQPLFVLDHPCGVPVPVNVIVRIDAGSHTRTAVPALKSRRAGGINSHLGIDLHARNLGFGQKHRCIELLLGILPIRIAGLCQILNECRTQTRGKRKNLRIDQWLSRYGGIAAALPRQGGEDHLLTLAHLR